MFIVVLIQGALLIQTSRVKIIWLNVSAFLLMCLTVLFQVSAYAWRWDIVFFSSDPGAVWQEGATSFVVIALMLFYVAAWRGQGGRKKFLSAPPRALFTPLFSAGVVGFTTGVASYPLWIVTLLLIVFTVATSSPKTRHQYWFGGSDQAQDDEGGEESGAGAGGDEEVRVEDLAVLKKGRLGEFNLYLIEKTRLVSSVLKKKIKP